MVSLKNCVSLPSIKGHRNSETGYIATYTSLPHWQTEKKNHKPSPCVTPLLSNITSVFCWCPRRLNAFSSALLKNSFFVEFFILVISIKNLATPLVFFPRWHVPDSLLHCCLSWSLHSTYPARQLLSTSFGVHTQTRLDIWSYPKIWPLGTWLRIVVLFLPWCTFSCGMFSRSTTVAQSQWWPCFWTFTELD